MILYTYNYIVRTKNNTQKSHKKPASWSKGLSWFWKTIYVLVACLKPETKTEMARDYGIVY